MKEVFWFLAILCLLGTFIVGSILAIIYTLVSIF